MVLDDGQRAPQTRGEGDGGDGVNENTGGGLGTESKRPLETSVVCDQSNVLTLSVTREC